MRNEDYACCFSKGRKGWKRSVEENNEAKSLESLSRSSGDDTCRFPKVRKGWK